MCIQFNVSLPTLNKFLMLYSLRAGSILLMFWYTLRSFACVAFVVLAIPELFTGGKDSYKNYVLTANVTAPTDIGEVHYFVYGTFISFLMTETTLFVHSCYLTVGVLCRQAIHIRCFLISRLYTWVMEIGSLIVLCFIHKIIIGWYLIMLMVFILELYSFGVIYSYYNEMQEERQPPKDSFAEWA